jgi:hypothetical protein
MSSIMHSNYAWRSAAFLAAALIISPAVSWPVFSQNTGNIGSHHSWPNDLDIVDVAGTVLVDAAEVHPSFALDIDSDGSPEYRLQFGPWWYEPPSGADRPAAGQAVTISGSIHGDIAPPLLIVMQLDGIEWRKSVEYGMMGWNEMPVWSGQQDTLSVSGRTLVDTTYYYHHYYLDADENGSPDYQLGFGPIWYVPDSGALRPKEGDLLTVSGMLRERPGIDMLAVYELDGLVWRSPSPAAPWAGTWMHMGHTDTTMAFCVNDSLSWVAFPPGHMGPAMHGGRWPDSSFVQFWQVYPDSMPDGGDHNFIAGYYMNVHDPSGESMMNDDFGGRHGMMSFEESHVFRFHYHPEDMDHLGLTEEDLVIWSWDSEDQLWARIQGVSIDLEANVIEFSGVDLSSFYAIGAPSVATAAEAWESSGLQASQLLRQNYPNPFTYSTTVTFDLPASSPVDLAIFDLTGRRLETLMAGERPAGPTALVFSTDILPGGLYVLRLQTAERTAVKMMTIIN